MDGIREIWVKFQLLHILAETVLVLLTNFSFFIQQILKIIILIWKIFLRLNELHFMWIIC